MGNPDTTNELRDAFERPLLGKVVDQRFRVLAHIGSGGMADVFEVEHIALGRRLAMKVLRQTRAANPQLARRFSREARAASRIDSEHVVSIHDYGMLPEGYPYFVMDLLRGQNLRKLLQAQPRLPFVRVANIAVDVCLGLHAAHSAGLVHRDLKPENLWLSRGDDGRELCVLLDFGVARFEGAHTTGDGVLVGTARYMSPEQIGSEQAPGPASDLFSLGVILYECIAGRSPFGADSLERTLFRILNEEPKPIGELAPELPLELGKVIERALAKPLTQRFGSALELAASLCPFAGAGRLLPSLPGATGTVLSDATLADEESEPTPTGRTERYADDADAGSGPASSRKWQLASTFALGLGLGAVLLLWLRPTPLEAPRAVASAAPERVPAEQVAVLPTSAPLPAPAAPPSEPTSAASASSKAVSARPSKLIAPAVPAAPHATRPELPRPDFDGRNPYVH